MKCHCVGRVRETIDSMQIHEHQHTQCEVSSRRIIRLEASGLASGLSMKYMFVSKLFDKQRWKGEHSNWFLSFKVSLVRGDCNSFINLSTKHCPLSVFWCNFVSFSSTYVCKRDFFFLNREIRVQYFVSCVVSPPSLCVYATLCYLTPSKLALHFASRYKSRQCD